MRENYPTYFWKADRHKAIQIVFFLVMIKDSKLVLYIYKKKKKKKKVGIILKFIHIDINVLGKERLRSTAITYPYTSLDNH